jgi:hypothetical protein
MRTVPRRETMLLHRGIVGAGAEGVFHPPRPRPTPAN